MSTEIKEFIYNGAAIIGQIKETENVSNIEDELRRMIVEKEVFMVKVSGMREDAVTANVLGEYMGIIPKAQVSNRMYVRNKMDDLIGQNVPVVITAFDAKTKTCNLSRVIAIKIMRKAFLDEILPIFEEIDKDGINYKKYATKYTEVDDPYYDKYPRVKAKVIGYDEKNKRILVNVAGLDIIGSMDISKFDHKYIYNPQKFLEEYMKPNKVIDVALLTYFDNTKDNSPDAFIVSRRHALPNPWKGIGSKIRVGDIIVVRVLEKLDSHFFGAYDNFPLDIKCYYPEAPDKMVAVDEKYGRRIVVPGKEYKVKVEIVNEKQKVLTASFVSEL